MTVRPYQAEDLEALDGLYAEGMSFLPCVRDKKRKLPNSFTQIMQNPDCFGSCITRVYCFIEEGRIVGFAGCRKKENEPGTVTVRHLVMEKDDNTLQKAIEAIRLIESELMESPEVLSVEFSALYEKAVSFWLDLGYQQSAPLRFIGDDVQIILDKRIA